MLQTNFAGNPPRLALFTDQHASNHQAPQASVDPPCPNSGKFLEIFEQLTGWRAEFLESRASVKRRQMIGMEREPVEGDFKIVDMSEDWPAKTPTAHREKCDQLVGLFASLMTELQRSRVELTRAHSALAALSPGSISEEEDLVDAFVPRFGQLDEHSLDPVEALTHVSANVRSADQFLYDSHFVEPEAASESDDDFEVTLEQDDEEFVVHQPVSAVYPSGRMNAKEAWKQWSVGGASGIANSVYLDWFLDEQKLTICVGRIESSLGVGDSETAIEIDPAEFKYRVTGDTTIQAFFVWDRRGGKLEPADTTGEWIQLFPGAAIFSSTTDSISAPDPHAELSSSPSADQLAKVVSRHLHQDERVFVLKRI